MKKIIAASVLVLGLALTGCDSGILKTGTVRGVVDGVEVNCQSYDSGARYDCVPVGERTK